jgi:hypothetical protein
MPKSIPRIAWRAGLDLNPVDVRSEQDAAWLETLVWPGQDERVARLHAAINIARQDPPNVVRGDLLTDLAKLAATAPRDATLVVFHTAVLGYVLPQSEREKFAAIVKRTGAEWISNEPPDVFPSIAKKAGPSPASGRFLTPALRRPWVDLSIPAARQASRNQLPKDSLGSGCPSSAAIYESSPHGPKLNFSGPWAWRCFVLHRSASLRYPRCFGRYRQVF